MRKSDSGRDHCWSSKKTLLNQLEKLWNNGLILRAQVNGGDLFPRRLNFKSPDSQALANEFDAVRNWIAEIHKLTGFRVVDKTVRHRVIGENSLPAEVWVDDLDTAVALLHKQREVAAFSELVYRTQQRAPALIDWISRYPLKALSLADVWPKLLDFVLWRQRHPDPAIYLRQISLPGIDTKFIEQNRAVLASLLDLCLPVQQIDQSMTGARQFEQRYGFRGKPERIRFRVLDPELALLPGADNDITVTAGDFQTLDRTSGFGSIRRVFITENEINFLAFPPRKICLAIFGAGYGFDALARADWLSRMQIVYWGDIDTHGFAILDQLRGKFPHVQSLLMDEATLLAHREFWVQETRPETRALLRLTPDEQKLYQALLADQYQVNLRLEQERIQFDYLIAALSRLEQNH